MNKSTLLSCALFLCTFFNLSAQITPITDANIRAAVTMWNSDQSQAITTYGHISNWNVSSVTDMSDLFAGSLLGISNFNADLSAWNVSKVTDMHNMFYKAPFFSSDISGWDVSSVTNMSHMFDCSFGLMASVFNADLSSWNVANVTDMSWMFANTSRFNSEISNWNVAAVTNMSNMFFFSAAFNQDLSGWDVSKVTNMSAMLTLVTAFSSENYTLFLEGIANLDLQTQVNLDASLSHCDASVRQKLIDNFGWTVNDQGLNTNCNTTLATNGVLESEIVVYPNPTAGFTSVAIPTNGTYRLLSTLGEQLEIGALFQGENNLNLSELKKGVYFIEIKTTDGTTVKKLVKS